MRYNFLILTVNFVSMFALSDQKYGHNGKEHGVDMVHYALVQLIRYVYDL